MPRGGFVLTAQIRLAAPTNVRPIIAQLQRQFRNANINLNINVNPRQVRQVQNLNQQIRQTGQAARVAGNDMAAFGKQAALALRRFGGFVTATFALRGLISKLKESVSEAIEFERQIVRIGQVTGKSVRDLGGLSGEITRLSTSLGVSSSKLAEVAQVLAQAGFNAEQTRTSLEALAKTDLAATFDDILQTGEGSIAIMRQFNIEAKDLDATLGAVNAVAGRFAVESSDIIAAVRRAGGAFAAAGGNFNEFISLLTSVRDTTRESAESISTGFRTIFTRLQRTRTVEFLEDLGIQLKDTEGQFVGPFEAIKRLSEALNAIPSTDPRFAQIVEELGGFRQVSKVIPLIQQFETAQKALAVAQTGTTSLTDDAVRAQESLAVQIQKVREEFDALIRKVAANDSFKAFVRLSLDLASALIKVGDALVPLLPAISSLGSLVGARAARNFFVGPDAFVPTLLGRGSGTRGFNRGGIVPGNGNSDTVPAVLTPGEFVIRKDAVKAIGAKNLFSLNKFQGGGAVKSASSIAGFDETDAFTGDGGTYGAVFLSPKDVRGKQVANIRVGSGKAAQNIRANLVSASLGSAMADQLENQIIGPGIDQLINQSASKLASQFGGRVSKPPIIPNINSITGSIFEGSLLALGAPYDDNLSDQRRFDFPAGLGGVSRLFNSPELSSIPTEAKKTFNRESLRSIRSKIQSDIESRLTNTTQSANRDQKFAEKFNTLSDAARQKILKNFRERGKVESSLVDKFKSIGGRRADVVDFLTRISGGAKNQGGVVDSVPALLTPGEFVINKRSASRIGLNNLKTLNRIDKFQTGGLVGNNVGSGAVGGGLGLIFLTQILGGFGDLNSELGNTISKFSSLAIQFGIFSQLLKQSGPVLAARNRVEQERVRLDRSSALLRGRANAFRDVATVEGQNIQTRTGRAGRLSNILRVRQNQLNASILAGDPQDVIDRLTQRRDATRGFFNEQVSSISGSRQRIGVARSAFDRASVFARVGQQRFDAATAEQARSERNANLASAAGVGATFAGDFLSRSGQSRISSGDFSGGARASVIAGGALSGAGQGALIGSAFGPVGTAIGAVAGAGLGLATELAGISDRIASAKLAQNVQRVSDTLQNLNSGLVSQQIATSNIITSLQGFSDIILGSDAGAETRQTAIGEFKGQFPAIEQLLESVARGSSTIDDFRKATGDTVDNLSILLGLPVDTVIKKYEDIIKVQQNSIDTQERLSSASAELANRLNEITSVAIAVKLFGTNVESFNRTVSAFSSGRSSGFGVGGDIGVLGSANARRSIGQLGTFLGVGGRSTVSEAQSISLAVERLPAIFASIAGQPLETSIDSLQDALEQSGVDARTALRLRNSLETNVLGEDLQPGELFKQIEEEGIFSVVDKIVQGLGPIIEPFEGISQEATKAVGVWTEAMAEAAQIRQSLNALESRRIDTIVQRGESRFAAAGINISRFRPGIQAGADAATLSRLTGGLPTNVTGLSAALSTAINQRNAVRQQIPLAGQGQLQGLLIQEDALSRVIENATSGLEFLADSASRTASIQQRLADIEEDRERVRGTALDFVFGSNQSRRNLTLGAQLTTRASQQGNLVGFTDQMRELVSQFIGRFGEDQSIAAFGNVGGRNRTRREFEDQLLRSSGLGITQGREEQGLRASLEQAFNTSISAQNVLINTTNTQLQSLEAAVNTGFNNTILTLERDASLQNIAQQQQTLGVAQANLGQLQNQLGAFQQLQNLGLDVSSTNTLKQQVEQAKLLIESRSQLPIINTAINTIKKIDSASAPSAFGFDPTARAVDTRGQLNTVFNSLNQQGIGGLNLFGKSPNEAIAALESRRAELATQINNAGPLASDTVRGNIDTIERLLQQIGDSKGIQDVQKQIEASQNNISLLTKNLQDAANSIPTEVQHVVNGNVQVNLTGTEALKVFRNEVNIMINNAIKQAFNDFDQGKQ